MARHEAKPKPGKEDGPVNGGSWFRNHFDLHYDSPLVRDWNAQRYARNLHILVIQYIF